MKRAYFFALRVHNSNDNNNSVSRCYCHCSVLFFTALCTGLIVLIPARIIVATCSVRIRKNKNRRSVKRKRTFLRTIELNRATPRNYLWLYHGFSRSVVALEVTVLETQNFQLQYYTINSFEFSKRLFVWNKTLSHSINIPGIPRFVKSNSLLNFKFRSAWHDNWT